MIIDVNDEKHIIDNLNKDIPDLSKKIKEMHYSIEKQLNKRRLINLKTKTKEWKNPSTKTIWRFIYSYYRNHEKKFIQIIPVTKVDKDYISINISDIELERSTNPILIRVFRGHFISRYIERVSIDLTPHQVIQNFPMSTVDSNVKLFVQNDKWLLYLDRNGIAMIRRKKEQILIFDTFIVLNQLVGDQKKAISNYIDTLNDVDHISFFKYLIDNPEWKEFVTAEKINILITKIQSDCIISPPVQEQLEKTISFFESVGIKITAKY